MTLLEAMSFGKVIVTTSVGGSVEILEDERTALFVPAGGRGGAERGRRAVDGRGGAARTARTRGPRELRKAVRAEPDGRGLRGAVRPPGKVLRRSSAAAPASIVPFTLEAGAAVTARAASAIRSISAPDRHALQVPIVTPVRGRPASIDSRRRARTSPRDRAKASSPMPAR